MQATELPDFDFSSFDRATISEIESLAGYAAANAKQELDIAIDAEKRAQKAHRGNRGLYSGSRVAEAASERARHQHALKSAQRMRSAAQRARMELQGVAA